MKGAPAKIIRPERLRNPFDSFIAYFETLFRRHTSAASSPNMAIINTAPLRASDSMPNVTPCRSARGNLVELLGDLRMVIGVLFSEEQYPFWRKIEMQPPGAGRGRRRLARRRDTHL